MTLKIFGLFLFLTAATGFAHEGGHGPKIRGKGPSGSRMVAVLFAQEIEMGEAAPIRAVAEWKRKGKKVTITLWQPDRKSKFSSDSEVGLKWIQIGKKLPKSIVTSVKTAVKDGVIEQELDLSKTEILELILDGFPEMGDPGKKVLAIVF